MNKKFKKRIIIIICIVSILVTSASSFVVFGEKKVKAEYSLDVAIFQNYLNNNYGTKLAVDGKFGCKTASAAVKAIQSLYNEVYKTGLVVDGKWGPKTEAAVNKHPLRKGARNKIVWFFQFTYNCIYVKRKALVEDGILGSKTANTIYEMCENNHECFMPVDPLPSHIYSRTWTFMLEFCGCGQFYVCPHTGI